MYASLEDEIRAAIAVMKRQNEEARKINAEMRKRNSNMIGDMLDSVENMARYSRTMSQSQMRLIRCTGKSKRSSFDLRTLNQHLMNSQ